MWESGICYTAKQSLFFAIQVCQSDGWATIMCFPECVGGSNGSRWAYDVSFARGLHGTLGGRHTSHIFHPTIWEGSPRHLALKTGVVLSYTGQQADGVSFAVIMLPQAYVAQIRVATAQSGRASTPTSAGNRVTIACDPHNPPPQKAARALEIVHV